jgi:hypothetical protein
MMRTWINYTSSKNKSAGNKSDLTNSMLGAYSNRTINIDGFFLTEETLEIFAAVSSWGFGQCVTIFGLSVNVLNVMTFVKQGVKDSVNISLLGLTISDLGSLVFQFFINLCWTPLIVKLDLPFYPKQFSFILAWAHILFTRVTTGTTAWITFERCVCIVAPLKVKSIITPRRTVAFIVVLYVIMTGTVIPQFYGVPLTLMFDAGRNRSIYIITVTSSSEMTKLSNFSYWSNNLIPTIFFILIVIFTTILVKALRKNSKWRQQTTSKGTGMSARETKVSKIVLIISFVFILCYFPGAVIYILVLEDPEMHYGGKHENLLVGSFSFTLFLEGINASVSFLIYLAMSSKFKTTLKELMLSCKKVNITSEAVEINNK